MLKNRFENGYGTVCVPAPKFPNLFFRYRQNHCFGPFFDTFLSATLRKSENDESTDISTNSTMPVRNLCVRCAVATRLGLRPRTWSHVRPSASLSSHSRSSGLITKNHPNFGRAAPKITSYPNFPPNPKISGPRNQGRVYWVGGGLLAIYTLIL